MAYQKGKRKTKKRKGKTSRQPEIQGIVCLMVAVIALASLFFPGETGIFGRGIKIAFNFLAGNAAWTLPALIGIIGFHLVYFKTFPLTNRFWGIVLIAILIIIAQHLDQAFQEELLTRGEIVPIGIELVQTGEGGGVLGAVFSAILVFIFGELGSFIVLVFIGLTALMLLTDTTAKDALIWSKALLVRLWDGVLYINEKIYLTASKLSKKKENTEKNLQTQTEESSSGIDQFNNVLTLEDYKTRKQHNQSDNADSFDSKSMDDDEIQNDSHIDSGQQESKDQKNSHLLTKKADDNIDKNKKHNKNTNKGENTQYTTGKDFHSEEPHKKEDGEGLLTAKGKENTQYVLPPYDLLKIPSRKGENLSNKKALKSKADLLENTLDSFGVNAKVTKVQEGPTITRYELQPEKGVKVSKIVNLSNDLALSLAASEVRIEAPIPGKAAIGIEVPNQDISPVYLREVLESDKFRKNKSPLSLAIGKDIAGEPVVADLSRMPHLLIAGATGSGKSVCINVLITSILFKACPDKVKLLLIDPKVVELKSFDGLPHLLTPVISNPKNASSTLKNIIEEMEHRYQLFAEAGVRDIAKYNALAKEYPEEMDKLPYIVIIIDELADLMMVAPTEVEDTIFRLAQMSRAAGIHLVLATQRPSVDVITGVIKSNITTRIAFSVSSQADSRTILDTGGAEKLLGQGDMLFTPVGSNKPVRLQGAFISDQEIEALVRYVQEQGEPEYKNELLEENSKSDASPQSHHDELLPVAVELVLENQQASISLFQRRLRIGYTRAARLVDELEELGVLGGHEGSKPRKILLSESELYELVQKLKGTAEE